MRIKSLQISNFRAISYLSLENLKDTVVIAGPNGCGKSCVFDAIRLLKSAYGGYQPNEWHQWFGEYQINVGSKNSDWLHLLQDRTKPLEISAEFELSDEERTYLRTNIKAMLTDQTWREVVPEVQGWSSIQSTSLAANLRVHQKEVEKRVKKNLPKFLKLIDETAHAGVVTLPPEGDGKTTPAPLLELVFSLYDPQNIGIIDYQGANRSYSRERVGGVNLNIESSEERMKNHALYNYANKYANLKTEMAGGYVRHLLSSKAGEDVDVRQDLSGTLKELFSTFIPGKEFLGPRPTKDGRLLFQVRMATGAEHDIDELSSGEKEVLYGYLRLRNAAPKNSVLLIDEPELHLNPRLVRGLATFYHRHLGRPLGTQLWLVTHSDALIREAVGQEGFSVFHLQPAGTHEGDNQASRVEVAADVDRLVIELVGDMAAYRPGAKIVVFEGESDVGFDVRMTCALFPAFQEQINSISGGAKHRVTQLYRLLEEARAAGHIPGRFYAITDSDGETTATSGEPRRFSWDAYHIENYLIAPDFILKVLCEINRATGRVETKELIEDALYSCADSTASMLIAHKTRLHVHQELFHGFDLNFNPARKDVAVALSEALSRSHERLNKIVAERLGIDALRQIENDYRDQAKQELANGAWKRTFRGRDILKCFVTRYVSGITYEVFRDMIIARMRDAEHQPAGMKAVVQAILDD